MVKNFLKLGRCLAMAAQSGISEAAHVDRIESSEEGAGVERCAWNSEVVWSTYLCHFERFRRVSLIESFERPQRRQVTELDRRILRVAVCEVPRSCELARSHAEAPAQRQVHNLRPYFGT